MNHLTQSSAQRKLSRGVEHVKTLRSEAETLHDDDNYGFRIERQRRTPNEIECRCFAIERKPLPDHWPLLAGEAIQSLRSALDHAVYAAVNGEGARTQFPIFIDPSEFQVRGAKMIQGIPETMRATIERAQPYNTAPKMAQADPLAQLNALSNLDKHRVLAVIASAINLEYVGVRPDITIAWEMFATNRPLGHGETHISTFVATAETELKEMDVHPGFDYEIRIEGRSLDTLVGIAKRVFEVLTECETGQPISPFATYPI